MKLEVKKLQKSFRQGERTIEILLDVSFAVEAGKTLAVLGQSGSGKSTLLALLAGLERPDGGSLHILGQDTSLWDEAAWARCRSRDLGIIFQQFHLMPDLTARENIELPLELAKTSDSRDRAQELLVAVGLADRSDHFPGQLSGGECQRVAIARALVARPSILLADEPTGNLDAETAAPVTDLLFELAQQGNAILVVVTHDDLLARRCGQSLRLRNGVLQ